MGASGSTSVLTTTLKHCTLFKTDRSPACRAVMMALDAMNLSITEVDVNMDKGEHRYPEMLVMNPLQTLPIFKDRELVICDSHAINTYLASRYNETGRLYPKDAGGRALIEQLLHYDSGVVYPKYRAASYPVLYDKCSSVLPEHACEVECTYRELENMLVGRQYLGGCWVTLGDISVAATVSTLNILVPIDKLNYPRLSSWLHRMSEEIFYITANKKGLGEFTRRIGTCCVCDDVIQWHRTSERRRAIEYKTDRNP
ncbi:glutathione S-transferase 1-like isoform X2 [Plodia interpunctella]|uniref:glutathione S-transferase 1-like isoform X2 n=1 Tax=Plodia interpunctella TaxID=58824 RepID=UPI00236783FD|nr:glutathione S-transferase 1-like isoform X2 [Plodia interpunctella]